MRRQLTLGILLIACVSAGVYMTRVRATGGPTAAPPAPARGAGELQIIDRGGKAVGLCPLEHTDVDAEISGFLSRTTVTQHFTNPSTTPIEAVYTFPLPDSAAVDRMTMKVGDRVVAGRIKRREEARAIYDAAREAGQVASLLDQERANIFTQSVANIMPGEKIDVTISYVETLKYEDGSYQYVFPMVVGPRYVPGTPTGRQGGGFAPDTDRVPDASKITPKVAPEGTRAGHDISLTVNVDAGVPLMDVKSTLHDVDVQRTSDRTATVSLKDKETIPNRDFILTYDVAGAKIENALLTHRDERGGFFTLILQPPDRVAAEDVSPRELVFVLDTSGSMSGFPIEKAKETMDLAFEAMRPQDTFNLITFSGDTHILFPQCVPATAKNLADARAFLKSRSGGGGTEMMQAIRAALEPSDKQDHVRVVCFFTDGYVGNDMEIVSEVQKHPNARVFSFGVGNSVNRFLLDRMASEGRGEVEYVTLNDDGSAAARRFHERVRNPLLTDVAIDWGGLPVADVYPARIPDVFSAKPIVVTGRFTGPGKGTIRLTGRTAGRDVVREMAVELPERQAEHDVLAPLWARRKIEALMAEDYAGAQSGRQSPDLQESITKLGLDFGLMTQYTSFVAVEEMVVNQGGEQRRVEVPVELPDGVSREGVFGADEEKDVAGVSMGVMGGFAQPITANSNGPMTPAPMKMERTASGTGRADGPKRAKTKAPAELDAAKPEDTKVSQPAPHLAKLDRDLGEIVAKLGAGAKPETVSSPLVRDGKVEVQVWLTDKSPEALEQLRKLGFEVILDPKSAKLVIGRIGVDRLEDLAKLSSVRYVAAYRG